MKVSIIIPVYNAEKTIQETLATIYSSHYSYEIICINDGSKDNSAEVINNLNNQHVKLYNRKNKGAAATRNEGIQLATGEYIMFCDADDKLAENIIDTMVKKIEEYQTDIVVGKIEHLINNQTQPISTYNDLKAKNQTSLNESPEITQSIGPYGKLYKKSILASIQFDEDITFCEEHTFNLKAWSKTKITIIEETSYLYNIGMEDSIVATSYKNIQKYLNDAKTVRERTIQILKSLDEGVNGYYSYRMDYLIIYFLIRNNFMKVDNTQTMLEAAEKYLKAIQNIETSSTIKLKTLVLNIAANESYKTFQSISTVINQNPSRIQYIKHKIMYLQLVLKMQIRTIKNKNKKIAH